MSNEEILEYAEELAEIQRQEENDQTSIEIDEEIEVFRQILEKDYWVGRRISFGWLDYSGIDSVH